jgi:hypothetical protein
VRPGSRSKVWVLLVLTRLKSLHSVTFYGPANLPRRAVEAVPMSFLLACQARVAEVQVGTDMVGRPARVNTATMNVTKPGIRREYSNPFDGSLLALLGRRHKLELVRCEHQIPNLTVCTEWAERLAVQSHFQAGRIANP